MARKIAVALKMILMIVSAAPPVIACTLHALCGTHWIKLPKLTTSECSECVGIACCQPARTARIEKHMRYADSNNKKKTNKTVVVPGIGLRVQRTAN